MAQSNFVTVCMDTTNKKEIKVASTVVRYFKPESGMQAEPLEPGETAEILSNHL